MSLINKETVLLGDLNTDYLASEKFDKHFLLKVCEASILNNSLRKSQGLCLV